LRTSRLVSMLLLLQVRGRVTAQALAEEFEVSIRTVYRDVEQLGAAGVPVYADRGPGGGFALLDGYRARLTGITRAEAETLSIAGLSGAASDLGLSGQLRAAQLKLVSALPDAAPDLSPIGSRLHVDPATWYRRPAAVPHLPMLASAVWEQKRISIHYESWDGEDQRIREPLGLVIKGGDWYLVARAHTQMRTYKVAAITRLTVLDESFERPADFDLRSEWTASVARFEKGLLTATAKLRIQAEAVRRLERLGAAAFEQMHSEPSPKPGWLDAVLPIEKIEHAAEKLLSLGACVEVLEPRELREQLRSLAERIATLNG
jgi:predicted DNA-binding transcriptional regulator YafY